MNLSPSILPNKTNVSLMSCDRYNGTLYTGVAVVRAFSGLVSLLSSLFVILLILIFKKHYVLIQRLVLYLSIVSAINGLFKAIQVVNRFIGGKVGKDYCLMTGFLEQTSDWSLFLATLIITLHIYMKAVHGRTPTLEGLYVMIIFLLPLTFNWIPFIHKAYGQDGPWCWIIEIDISDCKKDNFGESLRIGLWFIPSNIILALILILYITVLLYLKRQKHKYKGYYNPQQEMKWKMMMKEVRPLIFYPIILLVLQIPATINRAIEYFNNGNSHISLWFLHAFFSPLQGGLVCIAYALDPETRQRLCNCSLRMIFSPGRAVTEYPVRMGSSDSITGSQKENLEKIIAQERTELRTSFNKESFKTFDGIEINS